jgi:hypothetical protein
MILVACLGYIQLASAQTFEDVAEDFGIDVFVQGAWVGAGVSFFDFNNDGWDDLTFCVKGSPVKFYQNNGGILMEIPSFVPNVDEAKQPLWGDYDNDGDADLLITRYLAPTLLYENIGDFTFVDVSFVSGLLIDSQMKSYGAAWGDYDRDGWLDLYMCNYNFNGTITNQLYRNNGNGTFENVTVSLGVGNGQKPSFQPSFIDYNNDLWADIYIINDKAPENVLFKNVGDGTFEDVSASTGSNLIMDAMSNSWSDFDHDGDLDCYITNGTAGNKLLINQEGETFVESAAELGLAVYSICWGAQWLDYNNNGWDDLFVLATDNGFAGAVNYFFQNVDGQLLPNTESGLTDDLVSSYSNCIGDVNNDGYPDIAVSNEYPSNASLWLNSGGSNNYVKLTLEGAVSNRDGVGTWIEYFIGGVRYVKYTQSGSNYMGQSSQHLILGLGESLQVDSINLQWTSGLIDSYFGVPANSVNHFIEGQSTLATITPSAEGLCVNGTIELMASEHELWQWSTGDTTQNITVSTPGIYSLSVSDFPGIWVEVEVSVDLFPIIEPQFESDVIDCYGDLSEFVAVVNSQAFDVFTWSTGDIDWQIEDVPGGEYGVSLLDTNHCAVAATFIVEEPLPLVIELAPPESYPGELLATVNGGTEPHTYLWNTGDTVNPIMISNDGDYSLWVVDSHGCTLFGSIAIVIPGTGQILADDIQILQLGTIIQISGPPSLIGDVRLIDLQGKLLRRMPITSGELQLETIGQSQPVIVQIYTDGGEIISFPPLIQH